MERGGALWGGAGLGGLGAACAAHDNNRCFIKPARHRLSGIKYYAANNNSISRPLSRSCQERRPVLPACRLPTGSVGSRGHGGGGTAPSRPSSGSSPVVRPARIRRSNTHSIRCSKSSPSPLTHPFPSPGSLFHQDRLSARENVTRGVTGLIISTFQLAVCCGLPRRPQRLGRQTEAASWPRRMVRSGMAIFYPLFP